MTLFSTTLSSGARAGAAALFAALFVGCGLPLRAELTDAQTEATRRALDLAGAFANDGYKLRDGRWETHLAPGKPRVLAVHLYSGNEYWFCAASQPPSNKIKIEVFDEAGKALEAETYRDEGRAAAGVVADFSGVYYVRLTLPEGAATEAVLVYSYK